LDEDFSLKKLQNFICEIALFYKGSASMEWLEKQSLSKLKSLYDNAVRINKEINKNV
jgi:hypothetical protein